MPTQTAIRPSARVSGFTYAIRNIVSHAKKVEAAGRKVRYLNIGDPIPFGFKTPPHLIEAVTRALRDGHNGYVPSAGILPAREAVASDYVSRGMPVSADRVVLTSGTSEGIELALSALANPGDEVLVPTPTYPLYTAVLAKIDARAVYYPTRPENAWVPDPADIRKLVTPKTRAIVLIDPNNPTGAIYPEGVRRELIDLADQAGLVIFADEVYGDIGFDGPVPLMGSLAPDAPILSFSSLSKAYLAPGWRGGWLVAGRSERLNDLVAAIRKMADGRLCSPGPMQYAIEAAMTGDRSHQQAFVGELKIRADLTMGRLSAMPAVSCVAPHAAFYVMPKVALPAGKTDEDYVLALLNATGILCVHGSGFGMSAADGFFRIVFLAQPDELAAIYDDMAEFTARYTGRA
jgi:alanine-synthesizing transaminase